MEDIPAKPFYLTNGMVIATFFLAIIIPNVLMIGLGLFGPPPYLLDRSQFGDYANKARVRQGANVELQIREDAAAAKALAKSYVARKAKSGYSKTLDENRYVRDDNGHYELVVPIEEALVRVEGRDREHVDIVFQDLPFVRENPDKNILWIVLTDHLGLFFAGIFSYLAVCIVGFSHWHSAANTVRPPQHLSRVPEGELRRSLLALNDLNVPFTIREGNPNHMVAEWNVADADWQGVLSRGKLAINLRVRLAFDSRNSIVRAIQTSRTRQIERSMLGFLTRFSWNRTVGYGFESATEYGFLKTEDGWRPAKAYQYRFVPSEIVQPVANLILAKGWTFKPVYTFIRLLGG